jgi:hypothetical protein
MSEDQEYIASITRGLEEDIRFFDSTNKEEREIWVVNEFLTNIGEEFYPDEIKASDSEPPDVVFHDAMFEVKEILDPGRRRHQELKRDLETAKNATSMQDLMEQYSPRDITWSEIYELVYVGCEKYSKKYSSDAKSQLDILFYVNLQDARAYIQRDLPSQRNLENFGFRSVSFISGLLGGILMVREDAPGFLTKFTAPKVIRKVNA